MEAQVSFDSGFSSSAFFWSLVSHFPLDNTHRFSMGFRSGEFAGQSSTPTPWSFNQTFGAFGSWGRCQILLEMKSASLKSWSEEGSMKCFKIFLVKRVQ